MIKFTKEENEAIHYCFNEAVNGINQKYTLQLNYDHQALSRLFDQVSEEGKKEFTKEELTLIKKAMLVVIDDFEYVDFSTRISCTLDELLALLNKIIVAIG